MGPYQVILLLLSVKCVRVCVCVCTRVCVSECETSSTADDGYSLSNKVHHELLQGDAVFAIHFTCKPFKQLHVHY